MSVASQPASRRRSARNPRAKDVVLKEIQALRAIAVGLVVVYHVWPRALPGGFIGVDVFFVISGFLIGSHLLRELKKTGSVAVTWFWVRRIRRILPAAFVVLLSSIAAAVWLLPATMRVNTLEQIGAASVYVVNWLLAADSVDYLAASEPPTAVQHFWTLSVEEQFYIVWPLLLVALVWVVGRAATRRVARRTLLVAVLGLAAVVTVASFAYSMWLTVYAPSLAYFDTFARAWEFGVGLCLGSAASLWPEAIERLRTHVVWGQSRVLTAIGIATIVLGALFIGGAGAFPAPLALVPVIGAALVLLGGYSSRRATGAVLGLRPVQFLGDVSYSTYLWHWPIIIVFTHMVAPPGWRSGVVLIAASVVAAWLTKLWVEDPMRRASLFSQRRLPAFAFAAGGAAAIIVLSLFAGYATRATGADGGNAIELPSDRDCAGAAALLSGATCDDPFALSPSVNLAAAADDLATDKWCLTWTGEDWKSCVLGDPAGTRGTLALVGDSFAASYTVALGEYFAQNGWRVETYTRFGCAGLTYIPPGDGADREAELAGECAVWSARVRQEITSRDDIDAVVFIQRTPNEGLTPDQMQLAVSADDAESTFRTFLDSGKRVIAVKANPDLGVGHVPTCLEQHRENPLACASPRAAVVVPTIVDEAVARLDGQVETLDMTDAFCDDGTCYPVIGGVVVYRDERHVTTTYSRTVIAAYGPRLLELLDAPGA